MKDGKRVELINFSQQGQLAHFSALLLFGVPLVLGRHSGGIPSRDPYLSRSHALLYISSSGELRIRDMKSRNGTYVSEVRVVDRAVREGDEIRLGHTRLRVCSLKDEEG